MSNHGTRLYSVAESSQVASECELAPQIPDGEYCFKLRRHITGIMFGSPRLVLEFSIIDMGEYHGTVLKKYYNVRKLIGKAGKKGRFLAKPTGDLLIELCTLFPQWKITRLDRVPLDGLYNSIIKGKTRTVTNNNQRKKLPGQLKYSVIEKLIGIAT